jgi:hypothetical protein
MSSYYTTLKKGLKWYRKVMMEMIFGTALINAWIAYNLKSETKMTKLDFIESTSIIEKFTKTPLTNTTNIPPRASAELDQGIKHYLQKGDKKRNCIGCYNRLRQTLNSKEAAKKVKKVLTFCALCTKTYCHNSYNASHSVFETSVN